MFKVYFEKANDNVDWSFLDFVLLKEEFGERWRKWIMELFRQFHSQFLSMVEQWISLRVRKV